MARIIQHLSATKCSLGLLQAVFESLAFENRILHENRAIFFGHAFSCERENQSYLKSNVKGGEPLTIE